MAGTTNRITITEAADLLTGARACVAYVVDGTPQLTPASVRPHAEPARFLVAVDDHAAQAADADEVVLVVDDGVLFFDLRAIYVRGTPSPVDGPTPSSRVWFEIDATRVVCWDYGRLRIHEAPDAGTTDGSS